MTLRHVAGTGAFTPPNQRDAVSSKFLQAGAARPPAPWSSRRGRAILAVAALAVGSVGPGTDVLAADGRPLPRPTRVQAGWHDYELGMFVHFAPNTWLDQEYDDLSKTLGEGEARV